MNWKRTLFSLLAVFFVITFFYAREYIAGAVLVLGFTLILTDPNQTKLPFQIRTVRIAGALTLLVAVLLIGVKI
jgi:hypothetical protein